MNWAQEPSPLGFLHKERKVWVLRFAWAQLAELAEIFFGVCGCAQELKCQPAAEVGHVVAGISSQLQFALAHGRRDPAGKCFRKRTDDESRCKRRVHLQPLPVV